MIPTADAARLTGLSVATLREWTRRRSLITPDIAPKGRGSSAEFSWQTILVLRVAVVLHSFDIELEAQRGHFSELRSVFAQASFISLWGKSLFISAKGWSIRDPQDRSWTAEDGFSLKFDEHLSAISAGFGSSEMVTVKQLSLLPVVEGLQHRRSAPSTMAS